MKARSAIAKGRGFQKKIAIQLLEALAPFGDPPFDETDIHPAIGAQRGSDVVMTTRVLKVFPFDVECKKTKKPDVFAATRQVAGRCEYKSIVVVSGNNKPSAVFISALSSTAFDFGLYTDMIIEFEWGAHEEMTPYEMWLEDCRCNKGEIVTLYCKKDGIWYLLMDFTIWLQRYVKRLRNESTHS